MAATVMSLWDVPAGEWKEYARLVGVGCVTEGEYRLRLAAVAEEAAAQGIPVQYFRGTVAEILEVMRARRLENTPAGRAAAIGIASVGPAAATIGATIRERRKAVGLTQADLAAALGVDSPRVSDWERGRYKPRPKNAAALSKIIGGEMRDYLDVD